MHLSSLYLPHYKHATVCYECVKVSLGPWSKGDWLLTQAAASQALYHPCQCSAETDPGSSWTQGLLGQIACNIIMLAADGW